MKQIHKTIKSFLEKYDLNKSDLTCLVAFSGGFDSMCLLHALKKICKIKIVAIHLNHKWRGEESDLEEQNCKNFCQTLNIEFYSENLDTNIPKTETAAREARYEFFEKCAKIFNSKIIFTAHNKNDNIETLVYRICSGTGISGLQGISENRGIYYRPLISIQRKEIENYCKENDLKPNNDSSNANTEYKRNYIRATVMPALEEVNSTAQDSITSLSEIAKEETEIIEEYLKILTEKITENNKIKTKKFLKLSEPVQKRLIYNIFIQNNLDYDRKKILNIYEFIQENSNSRAGKTCSLTKGLWIFVSCENIEIIDKDKTQTPYFHITKEGKYENNGYIFEIEKFEKEVRKFPKDSDCSAYVNFKNLQLDFEIRTRQDGDIIKPFGLDGTQKLKKYLNEKKIPNHQKDNLLFMTQYNEVFWAIGLGISDKIKVNSKPTHHLKFYKKGQNNGN
ncbi:tRNA lysidine(34) synthetase TilS [bacterium]|nr:tRNA lysidine(34) synthetase TilS [bacterium]